MSKTFVVCPKNMSYDLIGIKVEASNIERAYRKARKDFYTQGEEIEIHEVKVPAKVFPQVVVCCGMCPNSYEEIPGELRCCALDDIQVNPRVVHTECPLDDFRFTSEGDIVITYHRP